MFTDPWAGKRTVEKEERLFFQKVDKAIDMYVKLWFLFFALLVMKLLSFVTGVKLKKKPHLFYKSWLEF